MTNTIPYRPDDDEVLHPGTPVPPKSNQRLASNQRLLAIAALKAEWPETDNSPDTVKDPDTLKGGFRVVMAIRAQVAFLTRISEHFINFPERFLGVSWSALNKALSNTDPSVISNLTGLEAMGCNISVSEGENQGQQGINFIIGDPCICIIWIPQN